MIVNETMAQSFIDTTKIWTVYNRIAEGNNKPTTEYYRFGEDTIINELTYTKMYVFQDTENKWHLDNDLWIEKEPGKLYLKSIVGSTQELLYDFTLAVGDTSSHRYKLVMDSIVVKDFGIEQRKYYYLHYLIWPDLIVTWVEGVGSLFNPTMFHDYIFVGAFTKLICFEEQNERIYLNPNFTDCDASTGTDVNTIFLRENLIECFYEPGGSIKIRNFTNSIGTFYLYDLKGSLLSKTQINSEETNICPPGSGILLYEFKTKKGKTQTGKIIVTD